VSDTFGSILADLDFCGLRSYEVQDRSTGAAITWATVAVDGSDATQYIITAAPSSTNSELQLTHNFKLAVSAPTTPTDYTSF
jgi:hypothetical protein